MSQTLLAVYAHPDDELGAAGALLAQRARGDRVVILWLTRGEMTEALGPLPTSEVARLRTEQGHRAGEILGVETRFLDMPDTRLVASPEAAAEVARVIVDVKPDGLLTWGAGWTRGIRHPDHQVCGQIARDAVTLARIAKAVAPAAPHRVAVPIFTMRDVHSQLPAVAVDVTPYRATIGELADFYASEVGFGDPAWLEHRLRANGAAWGFEYAEIFDAWETRGGPTASLLPAIPIIEMPHPDRVERRG